MDVKYLAIEGDIAVHERESKFWLSRNISSIRVSAMREGIEKALTTRFLFIGINADNINYFPQLKILREVTNDPIFIATSSYTMQEQGKALSEDADLFGQISDNPNENYNSVMACIHRLNERANQRKSPIRILTYGDILIAPTYHKAFINDIEICLTKNEMSILQYLVANRGSVLTHGQIFRKVFNSEQDESSSEVMYSTVRRLRKKMREAAQIDYIENVRDVGYRLTTTSAKTQ